MGICVLGRSQNAWREHSLLNLDAASFHGVDAALMSPLLYLHSYSLLSIFLHFSYSTKASMCINHPHMVVKNMGSPDSKQLTFSQMTN